MRVEFRDKVVCIIGAAGGIALAFAREGAYLALLDLNAVLYLAAATFCTGTILNISGERYGL